MWIYRFHEPKQLRDATVTADAVHRAYADGPRDAESLMVHPKTGRVYIASKNEEGGGLYAGPERLTTGASTSSGAWRDRAWATDGAFSPDGTRLVLRAYFGARCTRERPAAPTTR